MTETTTGRRERKKARTRQALADAAVRLFTERGFDNVGVREVAEAADVSLSTLFKHFPSKEALVFDLDADIESALMAAVRDRAPGQSVLHALRDHMVHTRTAVRTDDPTFVLVESTPALRDYARRMWSRHEKTLADTLAEATDLAPDDPAVTGLARFALEAPSIARASDDPARAMRDLFTLLEHGWATTALARQQDRPGREG
ncbi:TetR/AcrR family transcriptional regulator [Streptomyces griseocarneus]|uniref:TetR/AcrR family transcriptional regulator n=1 Tax=Streptomyces griseocarneus TaxID=51201 RepID=UPI00167DD008|nr:TetR/AcrR family transcriptional regulator [Streptomyces griseocarneus]MBZ6475418.1 TetR/AcrR family transcriptional regulator [Streptomyces griseocarneus]GHG75146.1 TetR family transcriptional regulator [Streptomyces griseocarneus]